MKSCPDCLFLIDDDQERCSTCESTALVGPSGGGGGVGTALLTSPITHTPPVADAPPVAQTQVVKAVKYRSGRSRVSPKVVLMALTVALVAVAGVSYSGNGPLAATFAGWNLTMKVPESFPQYWENLEDVGGAFEVEMPEGSTDVFEALDADNPSAGGLVGKQVSTDRDATLTMAWTTLGMESGALRGFDTADGIGELAERYADLRIDGKATVKRDLMLPVGHAQDVVFVDSKSKSGPVTTRARFVFAGTQMFVLSTSGPDVDAAALDAAHQRLLQSFKPSI